METRSDKVGVAAGLVLIALGAATAVWGVPHLRDPLILRQLKWSEYEQPQQPGLYAIASGAMLVVFGVALVRWYMRRLD